MTRVPDVLVVGGGVIGCACAFTLAREGFAVTLLEREELARQASAAAAGMLLHFGEASAQGPFFAAAAASSALFPELCAELRERSGIDPEFERSGALYTAVTEAGERALREKVARFAAHGLAWLDPREARGREPGLGPELRGAAFSAAEGHVRSALLARAFAGAAAALGARAETGVAVTALLREGARVTGVATAAGARPAGAVVLCAGAWSTALLPALPVEPVHGQILALECTPPRVENMIASDEIYLVPRRDGTLSVGATVERTGFERRVTAGGVETLLAAAMRLLPALAEARFRDACAGLRPATPDRLPAIGPWPGLAGLLVAGGHYRNGVLLAPYTARLVADLLLGKPLPPEAAAFDPARFARSAVSAAPA
jgi:glycine oxidase